MTSGGANQTTSMASPWIDNPYDKDWLLLKHRIYLEDYNVDLMHVQPRLRQMELVTD